MQAKQTLVMLAMVSARLRHMCMQKRIVRLNQVQPKKWRKRLKLGLIWQKRLKTHIVVKILHNIGILFALQTEVIAMEYRISGTCLRQHNRKRKGVTGLAASLSRDSFNRRVAYVRVRMIPFVFQQLPEDR